MKTLVIAEKPSVGRDIARVLGCQKKENGYQEGPSYVVTWALGHLVTLQDPEDYDKKYKEWKLELLPMMPERLKTKVIPQTGKQFRIVAGQLERRDISRVVIATDAGREGELVARWILDKAHCRKPLARLWISSVTDKAIREGFAHLKDAKEYENLYHAAVCRAEADWLVGINATRALTCKYNAQLSCGRVQTPTLAMIDRREQEIRAFVPEPYYTITAAAGGVTYTWRDSKSKGTRTFSRERAQAVAGQCGQGVLTITQVEKKAVIDAALLAGAGEVRLVEEPMAAALGADLPVQEAVASMVLDIGGGTSEVAVISLSAMSVTRSLRIAGDVMNDAVRRYMRDVFGIVIGENSAERLKIELGTAVPVDDGRTAEVMGKDAVLGTPKTVSVSEAHVREALRDPLQAIAGAVLRALEMTPPELAADIYERGMLLAGGGGLLRGLDQYLAAAAHIPVRVDDDPLTTVLRGSARAMRDKRTYEDLFIN